jgi:hypothetical protein
MSDEDELTAADREFEAALRSLRPVPVRIEPTVMGTGEGDSPLLLRRLRTTIAAMVPGQSPVRYWQVAAAIAVVAGGAWMAISHREMPVGPQRGGQAHFAPKTPHDHRGDGARPVPDQGSDSPMAPATLLAYRQALAKSSAEFEALLDQQAGMGTMRQNSEAQLMMLTLRTTHL